MRRRFYLYLIIALISLLPLTLTSARAESRPPADWDFRLPQQDPLPTAEPPQEAPPVEPSPEAPPVEPSPEAPPTEVTPVGTVEATPEATPRATAQATQEFIPGESTPEPEAEVTAEPTAEVTPEATEEPLGPLEVAFTYYIQPNGVVEFYDITYANIVAWSWDFGDGFGTTEKNPIHAYSQFGLYVVSLSVEDDKGRTGSASQALDFRLIAASIPCDFTATSMGAGVYAFSAIADPDAVFAWDFGDGQIITEANPSYTFPAPATYPVTLICATERGSTSATKEIVVERLGAVVEAIFEVIFVGEIGAPQTVRFNNTSVGPIVRYAWDFTSDGRIDSEEAAPSTVYETVGNYAATLTVYGENGESSSATRTLTIVRGNDAPSADFTFSPAAPSAPATVSFNDASQNIITAWLWTLPDGTTQNTPSFSYTFPTAGTYPVTLQVTGPGGTDSITKEVVVTPPVMTYSCNFNFSPRSGRAPLTVTGQASVSVQNGEVVAWLWDFGDGTSAEGERFSVTYAPTTNTTYNISLSVTLRDLSGAEQVCNISKAVTVLAADAVSADLVCRPNRVAIGQPVTLSSRSTGPITTWIWDDGNGAALEGAGPHTVTYSTAGTYTARLTVANAAGATSEDTCRITVIEGIEARFDGVPSNLTVGQTFRPRDRSLGPIMSWLWDFGDGVVREGQDPASYAYPNVGVYTVTLTVADGAGNRSSASRQVTVRNNISAAFNASPTTVVVGEAVTFSDASTGPVTSWLWDFGDGTTFLGQNPPPKVYEVQGTYTVTLTAQNAQGLASTAVRHVTVVPRLSASISAEPLRGVAPLRVNLVGNASGQVDSWEWEFSNGWRASGQSVSLVFGQAGQYSATLTVRGPAGMATATQTFEVFPQGAIRAAFTPSQWSGVAPLRISFTDNSVGDGLSEWAWDFDGDGAIDSTEQNPVFAYTKAGRYPVRLTVRGTVGTATATNIITVFEPAESRVSFSWALVGERRLRFTPDAQNATLIGWDFGDGQSDETAGEVEHTYAAGGTYEVTLLFRDLSGQIRAVSRLVTVGERRLNVPVLTAWGACDADGLHVFVLENSGSAMTRAQAYSITAEDSKEVESGEVLLGAGEKRTFTPRAKVGRLEFSTGPLVAAAFAVCQPKIDVFDPALSKIGYLPAGSLGLPGEELVWETTVTNNGTVAGTDVVIVDNVRPELRIDAVSAPGGTYTISGQEVTVTYASLGVGESRTFTITTTVLSTPYDHRIDNTVRLQDTDVEATAVVVLAMMPYGPPPINGPIPRVDDAPNQNVFAGGEVCIVPKFYNVGIHEGYAPYVIVVFPPDFTFNSATYLGSPSNLETPIQITPGPPFTDPIDPTNIVPGVAGSTAWLLQPRVGAVTTGGPTLDITVCAAMNPLAAIEVQQDINVYPGYRLGDSPTGIGGPDGIDGPISSQNPIDVGTFPITPILVTFDKSNTTPESERPPGPVWAYDYNLTMTLAPGQTLTNVVFFDQLDSQWQYTGPTTHSGTCNASGRTDNLVPSTVTPGGQLQTTFATVTNPSTTNTCTLTLTYTGYITDILSETNSGPQSDVIHNDATFNYMHLGNPRPQLTDSNDVLTGNTVFQKSASPALVIPGDKVNYSVVFQATQYGQIGTLTITDTMPDGMDYDGQGLVTVPGVCTSVPIAPTITSNPSGTLTLVFNVTAVCPGPYPIAATGTLSYRGEVRQLYRVIDVDSSPGPDPVRAGDQLNNTVQGQFVLTTGATLTNDSAASVRVRTNTLAKQTLSTPVDAAAGFVPGEPVTFRLTLSIPSGDTRNIVLTDFMPLPVFDVDDTDFGLNLPPTGSNPLGPVTISLPYVNDEGYCASYPNVVFPLYTTPCGIKYGPGHTLSTAAPIQVTIQPSTNAIIINLPDIDTNAPQVAQFDITLAVVDRPFADSLYLSNIARASTQNTPGTPLTTDAIDYLNIGAPSIRLCKGVESSSNASTTFTTPGTPSGCAAAENRNAGNADAGDELTYIITAENIGGARAYNVRIADTIPPGLTGCALDSVKDGTGASLAFTGSLFTPPGITLTNALPSRTTGGGLNKAVVRVKCTIGGAVVPGGQIENTATALFAPFSDSLPGGTHLNPTTVDFPPVTDTARVNLRQPTIDKQVIPTNATIGQLVTYTLAVEVPAGQAFNATLTDTLPTGMAFVDCISLTATGLTTNAVGGFASMCNDPTNPTVTGSARTITWNLGDLTAVGTAGADNNTINITYTAVVLNEAAVIRGATLTNTAVFRWEDADTGGTARTVQDTATVTVIEPSLQLAKAFSATTGDAGDIVNLTLTVSHTAASNATAHNVVITDPLPAGMSYLDDTCPDTGVAPTSLTHAAGLVTISYDVLSVGQTSGVCIRVSIDNTVQPREVLSNTATSRWSSLAGTVADVSPYVSPNDAERTGNPSDPGGANNTYSAPATATYTINAPTAAKAITATSEPSTGNGADSDPDLTIGEIVTYTLTFTFPEGTTQNVTLEDDITTGGVNMVVVGTPTITAIGSNLSFTPAGPMVGMAGTVAGDVVTWNLGTILNTPDGTTNANDRIVVQIQMVVTDNPLNNGLGTNDKNINNRARLLYNTGPSGTCTTTVVGGRCTADNNRRVDFVEPELQITKSTLTAMPVDAGLTDVVRFRLVVSHTTQSTADAFNLLVRDTLPAQMSYVGNVTSGGCGTVTTTPVSSTVTDYTIGSLGLGGTCTIEFDARLLDTARPSSTYQNTAQVTQYDSTPVFTAGQTRRKSTTTATSNVTTPAPTLAKVIHATSRPESSGTNVLIGEEITYRLTATLTEGTSPNFILRDTLPSNLEYLSSQVLSIGAQISGSSLSVGDPCTHAAGVVTCNFGTVTNTANDVSNAGDRIVVEIVARVNDIPANVNATVINNSANLSYQNQAGSTITTPNQSVSVTVIEPVLTIVKDVTNPIPAEADAGDIVTYQVVVTNTGTATAFDVVITDALLPKLLLEVGTVTTSSGTVTTGNTVGDTTIRVDVPTIPVAGTVTITYKAKLAPSVVAGESLVNTARINEYFSKPSTDPNDRRQYGPVTDTATVTVLSPGITKVVHATSDPNTGNTRHTASDPDVAIGEEITYRITITMPEGTTSGPTNAIDILPSTGAGDPGTLGFISATVVSIGGNTTVGHTSGGNISGLAVAIGAVIPAVGQTITFGLGPNINNTPDGINNTLDEIVLEVRARVLNIPANADADALTNRVTLDFGTGSPVSAQATVDIVEPELQLAKAASPTTGLDAGDTVTYTLTISHTAASDAIAYDVQFTDTLPVTAFTGAPAFNAAASTCDEQAGFAQNFASPTLTVSFNQLALGASCTLVYTVALADAVTPNTSYINTARVSQYASQPTGTPQRRVYGPTPDVTRTITTTSPTVQKVLVSSSHTGTGATVDPDVTLGETVTYDLIATLPEGTINGLVMVDEVPTGMQYVSHTVSPAAGVAVNGADPVQTGGASNGDDVTFTFNNPVVVTGDNVANNTLTIRITLRVLDVGSNNNGTNLPNILTLDTSTTTPLSSPPVVVTVREPDINMTKTFSAATAERGDTLTIDFVITNNGTSTAYDLTMTDVMDSRLRFDSINTIIAPAYVTNTPSNIFGYGGTLSIAFNELRVGDSITVRVNIFVSPTATPLGLLTNTAQTTYDSLPGNNPVDRNYTANSTGSVTLNSVTNPSTIGNFIWFDTDGDGAQDAGESGIPGVTVQLRDALNNVIATTTTDANGNYSFTGLPAGTYTVSVVTATLPPSVTQTFDADGLGTAHQSTVNLPAGTVNNNQDFGYQPAGAIGNFIWYDVDADGVQDGGIESGIPGVVVELRDAFGNPVLDALNNPITTTTNANGFYSFTGLPLGTYTVRVRTSTLPDPTWANTYDLDNGTASDVIPGSPNHEAVVTLTSANPVNNNVDFGYQPLGQIGSRVWNDLDRDGIQDIGENGIPGATVQLLDGTTGTVLLTTPTDGTGNYLFDNLPPGNYRVRVLLPNWENTYDLDNGTPTDPTPGSPNSLVLNLTLTATGPGRTILNVDFGYVIIPPDGSGGGGGGGTGGVTPPVTNAEATPLPSTLPALAQPLLNVELCTAQCVDWQMYHTDRTGDWEIWAMGNIQGDPNLSQGVGADDMAPSRSPNSNYIAFTSNRDGNWELYIGRADGSLQERVTFNTIAIDTDPYWGPTNAIVYESSRDGNWNLFIFNPLTGEDLRVTNDLASDINAAWSPDGTHLIFQSNRDGLWQIYRLDLATLQVTRLSDGTARDFDPVYSNAGDKIAFRRYVEQPDGTFSAALFLMNPDGTGVEQISSEGGEPNSATWSPNDRYIAYQSDLDGDLDIYVYDTQSGETRQLTDNTIRDYAPAWLCSGDDQLLFTSEIEGNPDIFQAQASPVSAPPIDVMAEAIQRTDEPDNDVYPADTPLDEDASREGQLPQTKGDFGQQTEFLLPDMTITLEDSSIVNPEWQPLDSCGAPFAFRNSLSAQPSQRRGGQGGLGLRR